MTVKTTKGRIRGIDQGTYTEYRGIPYAKPPVGALRWRAPQATDPWEGVYEATDFKNRCMQEDYLAPPYDKDFYSNPDFQRPSSEDCLYLHVWAPNQREKKLPVAFWIHGGGFMGGFSSELEFDGKAYCERAVILVSVEYRCNIFGFLAHPWLSEEDEEHVSGNYGILDQIAALRWVYENIEAFGGDKNNITVFGQSAGAMSTQTLISSRLTENMIAKAIMQSGGSYGGGLHVDITLEEQERVGQLFSKEMGVRTLEEMRALPAEQIVSSMMPILAKAERMELLPSFMLTPTIDGRVLEDGYYSLIDQGKTKDIPYLLGTTKNDIMTTPEMVHTGEFSPLYQGCIDFSLKQEELGRTPAWVYYFDHDLPGDHYGAWHSGELWYMFGTLDRCWRPWTQGDYELSDRMLDYWTNFMKTGDPNCEELPTWSPCSQVEPTVLELNV